MSHDPKNWIDVQRDAGSKRGNIYTDILRESARVRAERQGLSQAWVDRRVAAVEGIKTEAAQHDADVANERAVRTFDEMVARWKAEG